MNRGSDAAALDLARALLARHPESGFLWKACGVAASRLGLDALPALEHAARLAPGDPDVHYYAATVLRDRGDHAGALDAYRRVLQLNPSHLAALLDQATLLRRSGRLTEAAAVCRRAVEVAPRSAEAHNNLGNVLRDLGLREESVASYGRALELDPRFAISHSNLGNVLRDLGHLSQALACYARALDLRPELAEVHNNLGNVHLDLMQLDAAAANYDRALALKPDYLHAMIALAMVQRLQGRASLAEAGCRRALALAPSSAEALAFLGELQADQGRFDDAEVSFKRALDGDPDLPAAWAGLARYRRMSADDASWLAAADRLVAGHLPLRHEIPLRFAIGKYFDDTGEFDRAFDSYRHANTLAKRFGVRYDRTRASAQIDRIMATDASRLMRPATPAPGPARALFVVGMPRSGTTLAEQILASHPQVFGAGELPFWNDAAAIAVADLDALARRYMQELDRFSAEAARVVDKMPTNFMNLGLIHAALPGARIIHMRRHPIDTCLSIYFQNFSISHAYANDLADLAHHYADYHRLMAYWRKRLPPGCLLEVPYEELVREPETWSRTMLEFIGLPWDARCLEFHRTARTVTTPSKWQVRQKITQASSGRWLHYRAHVDALLPLLELAD